ncbi:MAG: 5-methyltetrahydropteroyltriglutamate--homocysteine S-methyltransferase, partial [Pseudolabrys sp.]
PPFRADHVGSLLRPAALRQAFRKHGAKEIGDAEFTALQDNCIRDVVAMQEQVGLKVVSDGEFRRGSYWGRFVERIDGFAIKSASFKFRNDAGHEVEFTAPYATKKIKRLQPLALDEFLFLRGATRLTGKITLPAPSTMHFYRCNDFADRAVYADAESFFADLAKIFRQEIAELAKAGCRYVQLDEVAVALLCDPAIRDDVTRAGNDPDMLVDLYIKSINDAVVECPSDVVIGVHMCRGNFKGHYLGAGGYESVAERFFASTNVNHFLLEYDTPRAGDFAPLRFVPKDKGVVLGVISSKTPVLEGLDALKRRVDEAARHIDLDRLAIGPQCGFASTVAGNPVTEDDERRKLTLVVEAARQFWP